MDKDIVIPPGQELPSQAAWDEMIRGADRVQILEGGTISYFENQRVIGRPLGTKVLFESHRPEDLESLRTCVRFRDDAQGAICMCLGQLAFLFFQGEERIAVLGFHHGVSLRWDRWFGDGPLLENQGILDWLSERGIDGPAQDYAAAQRRRVLYEHHRQRWFAAMPACLAPFEQQMRIMASQGGSIDTALLLQAMEEGHPDPQERARLLFHWYGHGSGPWSGFPVYEKVPEKLLLDMPVEVVIQALDGVELEPEELEGAARHFSSWDFRKRFGSAWKQLPEPLNQQLLDHALQTINKDRALKAFVPR